MRLNLKVYFNFDTIANKWCQITHLSRKFKYRISSYSFRRNYSFLNLEIQRPKDIVHKCAETIQGGKLFKGGNYMRKYGMLKTRVSHGTGQCNFSGQRDNGTSSKSCHGTFCPSSSSRILLSSASLTN